MLYLNKYKYVYLTKVDILISVINTSAITKKLELIFIFCFAFISAESIRWRSTKVRAGDSGGRTG